VVKWKKKKKEEEFFFFPLPVKKEKPGAVFCQNGQKNFIPPLAFQKKKISTITVFEWHKSPFQFFIFAVNLAP